MAKYQPFLPPLLCFLVLSIVIYFLPAPASLTQAAWWQIGAFFLPLVLFLFFTLNLYFKFPLHSLTFSLALLILIILHLLGFLTWLIAGGVILATLLIYRSVRKRNRYLMPVKIPKLSRLAKQR